MAAAPKDQSLILITDDNAWIQRILAKILVSYGLKPAFANNGYEAVARAIELKPTIIILDVIMPDLNGIQTLRMLKTIGLTRTIPVLIVTAAADADKLDSAVKLGAAGFIRKPFSRSTIYDKLVEVMGKENLHELSNDAKKMSDDELDKLMKIQQAVGHVGMNPRSSSKRGNQAVVPSPDSSDKPIDAHYRFANPDLNRISRRGRSVRHVTDQEVPDEQTILDILKHTTRR